MDRRSHVTEFAFVEFVKDRVADPSFLTGSVPILDDGGALGLAPGLVNQKLGDQTVSNVLYLEMWVSQAEEMHKT